MCVPFFLLSFIQIHKFILIYPNAPLPPHFKTISSKVIPSLLIPGLQTDFYCILARVHRGSSILKNGDFLLQCTCSRGLLFFYMYSGYIFFTGVQGISCFRERVHIDLQFQHLFMGSLFEQVFTGIIIFYRCSGDLVLYRCSGDLHCSNFSTYSQRSLILALVNSWESLILALIHRDLQVYHVYMAISNF